jgi:hypothetical protein
MARIVCLANSYKGGGKRCIAGIDIKTGEWVRPISRGAEKAVDWNIRKVDEAEPEILDILDIPLEDSRTNEEYQPENRFLTLGKWRKISRLDPQDLLKYCEDDNVILHNHEGYVLPELLSEKASSERKSLQLIHSVNVKFNRDLYDSRKWRVVFQYGRKNYLDLKLTDVVLSDRLRKNEKISNECILTISLATPWKRDDKTPERCYKMVAGVIEL